MWTKIKTILPCCLLATGTLPFFTTSCGTKQTKPAVIVEDSWRLNYVYNDDISGTHDKAQFKF